ncbi:phosphoribosyltransferase [Pedobacter sp. BS3]|uniref:phosphoribosyltransferase n=1 Tax=Pedobacter sp. BS3 TaxID=2567937 RepID=UPI0011F062CC|nr:phosphoribosyltransferase family protein [Pedobacter sp. BS3]TZF81328.1 phosphoribosyltransferase [Pedobacter sp. BS3]
MENVWDALYFKNREHAGKELGLYLEPKYKRSNPLILGIPRGGVEVAWYVSQQLQADLSLAISKKLPVPGNEEYGFGAVAEEYSVYVSPEGKEMLSPKVINQIIEEKIQEINRRVAIYRQGKPLPDMKKRTVILVDDGIATGVTLVPLIRLCRKKQAAKVIVAAPVSGKRYDTHLNEADAIEVMVQPHDFYAVGQVYETFGDFTDSQLLNLLKKAGATERNRT